MPEYPPHMPESFAKFVYSRQSYNENAPRSLVVEHYTLEAGTPRYVIHEYVTDVKEPALRYFKGMDKLPQENVEVVESDGRGTLFKGPTGFTVRVLAKNRTVKGHTEEIPRPEVPPRTLLKWFRGWFLCYEADHDLWYGLLDWDEKPNYSIPYDEFLAEWKKTLTYPNVLEFPHAPQQQQIPRLRRRQVHDAHTERPPAPRCARSAQIFTHLHAH